MATPVGGTSVLPNRGDGLLDMDAPVAPPSGGEDLESNGYAYFIGQGGNNNNTGRSHSQRWADFTRATGLPVSSQVYVQCGYNLTLNNYTPNWNGTSANPAVYAGSYYLDGNQPTRWREGAQAKQNAKPILTCNTRSVSAGGSVDTDDVINLNNRSWGRVEDVEIKRTNFAYNVTLPGIRVDGGSTRITLLGVRERCKATMQQWYDHMNKGPNNVDQYVQAIRLDGCTFVDVLDSDILYNTGECMRIQTNVSNVNVIGGQLVFAAGDACRISTSSLSSDKNRMIKFENMRLGGSWRSDGSQTFGNLNQAGVNRSYNIIYRGVDFVGGPGENAIDRKTSYDVLVERCIVHAWPGDNDGPTIPPSFDPTGPGQDRASVGALITGTQSYHCIGRFNFFYDNSQAIRFSDGMMGYANTLVAQQRDYTGPLSSFVPGGGSQVFCAVHVSYPEKPSTPGYPDQGILSSHINSIVANNVRNDAVVAASSAGTRSAIARLEKNVYYRQGGSPTFVYGGQNFLDLAAFQAALQGDAKHTGDEAGSVVADPQFVNLPQKPVGDYFESGWDVTPQNAACIGTAVPLTTTRQAGTNQTVVPVDNAYYFWAGWPGEPGDYVKIGNSAHVQITAVDRAARTITIASGRSYGNGDGIHLTDADGVVQDNLGCAQPSFTLFDGSELPAAPDDWADYL